MKMHVVFPDSVFAELKRLVPTRRRNRFIAEAVRIRLQALRTATRTPISHAIRFDWWASGFLLIVWLTCPAALFAEESHDHLQRQRAALEQYNQQLQRYDQLNAELRMKVMAIMMQYEVRKRELMAQHQAELQKALEALNKKQSDELDRVVPPEYRPAFETLKRKQPPNP